MPELRIDTVKARYIKVDDEIQLQGESYTEIVDDIDPKQKWMTLSTDYGTKRILMDEMVKRYSMVPTAEEAAENRYRRSTEAITHKISEAPGLVEAARVRLVDNLHMKSVSWHGDKWADYAMAQTEAELWMLVAEVVVGRDIGFVEATELVRDDVTKRLLNDSRFLNGSTSAVSNLSQALVNEVRARWLRELDWMLI